MKPLRKLTLSRKRSKQSVREQTPPVPDLPAAVATGATLGSGATATPPPKTPTKSRPPESSSAGTAAIGTLTADGKPKDASVRSKKNPPSAFNGVGAGNWQDQANQSPSDADSTRQRKSSIAKGKRRLSSIFSNSPSSKNGSQSRASSVEPEGTPLRDIAPTTPTANGHTNGSAHPKVLATEAPQVEPLGKLNDSSSSSTSDRALPALPSENGPNPAAISAAVEELSLNENGAAVITPAHSDASGFPLDAPSPARGPSQPISSPSTPVGAAAVRQAKVNSLYSQWADDSDDDDDDTGFATPSEGLSEVEEEDEEDDVKPVATKVNNLAAKTNGSATYPSSISPSVAASTLTAHSTGPKVRRTKAAGAKVGAVSLKAGDPLAIDQNAALAPDLDLCRQALRLFLSSQMLEAEELLTSADPQRNHLYLQSGHSLIESLKGLMTFDSVDILAALELTKGTAHTASVLRRPADSVFSKLGGLVRSGAGVARVKAMSPLELHAELSYAETILIKAILVIVGGGDWLGLIKEALNMRTAHGIYRTLQQFLDEADKNGFDDDIDMDFRSGVLLGTGTSSLMLSLLPARVLKIAEVFGYAGDRTVALETLMSAGGWTPGKTTPAYDESNEGIRRPICDMILLTFHLVISVLMPVSGVDLESARNILNYNTKRYPNGIFFLYFQARLYTNECEPELANQSLQRALELDLEYVQLQHMCLWDFGCNYMQLNNWEGARQCFDILRQESNWSRAVYTYGTAVTVMELAANPEFPECTDELAVELVSNIPKLVKKIAGKSLPIEKFAARKARKYVSQGNRLFLPAMELAYVFGSLGTTPRRVLLGKWLPHINAELARLEKSTPETWYGGEEYWDDYVLGHFLRGMVQTIARYQPTEASANARGDPATQPSDESLDSGAEADFKAVIAAAPNVRLDHYLLYHNHYELGRLYAKRGDVANARLNFEVVMNSKLPQPNLHSGAKAGKYSLEGALQIKTHAAMQDLKEGGAKGSIKSGKSGKGSAKH